MRIVMLMTLAVLLLSFAGSKKADATIDPGAYGVCDCTTEKPNTILLRINQDHTYTYFDYTLGDKSFSIKGIWSQKGRELVLENAPKGVHEKWLVADDAGCIKSRHKANFRRLCKVKCD